SSISASATRKGSAEAISTERPRRFSTPDAIADPRSRSPRAVRCWAPIKEPGGGVPPSSIASRRLRKLLHGVLIEAYKLPQIHREGSVFVLAEWVHARVHQRQFIVSSPVRNRPESRSCSHSTRPHSCCDTRHGSDPDCSARNHHVKRKYDLLIVHLHRCNRLQCMSASCRGTTPRRCRERHTAPTRSRGMSQHPW